MRRSHPVGGWSPQPRQVSRRLRRLPLVLLVPLLFGLLGAPLSPVGADELSEARARQDALAQQIKDQKAQVAQINGMQKDLKNQIASTKRELASINADLAAVRRSITAMIDQIEVVKARYYALVRELGELDDRLARLEVQEGNKRVKLAERKAILAERIREAYDIDRTSLLETFLTGGSFTDVVSEVGYVNDFAEQDKALAEEIVRAQEELAALQRLVTATRRATDTLRIETAAQKVELDRQLVELTATQKRLKQLEKETAAALAIQKKAFSTLLRNKKDLARAIATTASAQGALARKIDDLVQQQVASGNIPSQFNGSLKWPMAGTVVGEFGCSSYAGYGPGNGCEHFHNGIDIVAPAGCGAPVKAAGNGRVGYVGWNFADGADAAWIVIIVHSQDLQTWYAHLKGNTYPSGITIGAAVKSGQVIGYEGNTGNSTGCHLHWMVEYNGSFKNPRLFV